MKFTVKEKLSGVRAKSPEIKEKVVRYVSDELLNRCGPYIPLDTGMMRDSGISHSRPGEGRLIWRTPYVKQQWEHGKSKRGRPLQGNRWALRAWASCRKEVLDNAQKIADGKVKP